MTVAAAASGLGGRGLFDFPSTTRAISKCATARGSAASPPLPASSSSSSYSSTVPFLLADIGEGIAEVELLQWFVSPGDAISQFDRVCEVQSDKASVEITSRYDGVVMSLCGNVGDVVLVGRPLLHILPAGMSMSSGTMPPPPPTTAGAMPPETTETGTTTLNNVDDERDRLRIPSVGANYSSYYDNNTEGGGGAGGGGGGGGGGGERSSFTPRGMGGGPTMANDATNNGGGGGGAKVLTSPAVRKLGRENNIDLGTVMGTGPGGRVLKADVLGIINPAPSSSSSSSSPISPSPSPPRTTAGGNAAVPIRGYHRLMVKTMTTSLQVPHMVYSDEVNVDALTAVRDSLRPLHAARQHAIGGDHPKMGKLTYMPFFVKAASLAMTSYPVLNATIDVGEMTLTYHDEHRIGIAVDTPKGLAVPVVGDCRNRSVLEIADELNRLYSLVSDRGGGGGGGGGDSGDIEGLSLSISLPLSLSLFASSRGRVLGFQAFGHFSLTFFLGPPTAQYQATEGNLSEADIAGPTFTLSNIGAIGGTYMSPVVLPPQVAIGGE